MEMDDISKVESYLVEMDESMRRIQGQVRSLRQSIEMLTTTCQDEPEIMEVVRREDRYVQQLMGMVDEFTLSRMVRRRLPTVEGRIQQQEDNRAKEEQAVQRQASAVRDSLEDLLQKFLQ